MKRLIAVLTAAATLGACTIAPVGTAPPPSQPVQRVDAGPRLSPAQAVANFNSVVRRMEPVAEQVCRERTRNVNCDFKIVVDQRRDLPPNAFQTLEPNGRPVLGFTLALIADMRNADELAFVLGHEAAHHIQGHIPTSQRRAVEGALLGTVLATIAGADAQTVETAQQIAGSVNARRFSKEFELEADALGTRITARAGYDPLRGAAYFARTPDPGNRFLGTHPPNADRIATVRRVAAGL